MSVKITVEISIEGAIKRFIDWPEGWTAKQCDEWWTLYKGKNKSFDDLMREYVIVRPDHFRIDDPRREKYAKAEEISL